MKIPQLVTGADRTAAARMRAYRDRKRGAPAGRSGCKQGTGSRTRELVLFAMALAMDYHSMMLAKTSQSRYSMADIHEKEHAKAASILSKAILATGPGVVLTVDELEMYEDWIASGHKICA